MKDGRDERQKKNGLYYATTSADGRAIALLSLSGSSKGEATPCWRLSVQKNPKRRRVSPASPLKAGTHSKAGLHSRAESHSQAAWRYRMQPAYLPPRQRQSASASSCIRASLKVLRLDASKSALRREASSPSTSTSPSWWTSSVLKAKAVVAVPAG